MTEPAPFIIWTLRRTGGTNLSQALFERVPFPKVPHEPFNHDRLYGPLTRAFIADRDEATLRVGIDAICARGVTLKHCAETVPPKLNTVLADASMAAGYRHVFLYRRSALDRLLSLIYAQRTGVWGPGSAASAAADEQAFMSPLDIDHLLGHERVCRAELSAVHARLLARGATPQQLVFEDLLQSAEPECAATLLRPVLLALGLAVTEDERSALALRLVGAGEQGTRERYRHFSNWRALEAALQDLGPFVLEHAAPRSHQMLQPHDAAPAMTARGMTPT
jgi:hypothetical protein